MVGEPPPCPKKAPTSARMRCSHVFGERAGPFRVPERANLGKMVFERSLTCVYSDVPDELAGLFESLSTVMAAVGEPTAIDVFLVVPGTTG